MLTLAVNTAEADGNDLDIFEPSVTADNLMFTFVSVINQQTCRLTGAKDS